MIAFKHIFFFELRLQLKSPLFWVLCAMLFALNFIAQSDDSINLGTIRNLININSPYQVILTSVLFSYISMLPILIFVVHAVIRDFDRKMAELIYVSPISEKQFLLGRFLGSFLLASLITAVGLAGSLVAELMPWIDPDRLAAFTLSPYIASYFFYTLPFVFVISTFSFSVASLTRSQALSFSMAIVLLVFILSLPSFYVGRESQNWMILLDPSGQVALTAETLQWSVTELNNRIPGELLLGNRLLWMLLSVMVLAFSLSVFRFKLQADNPLLNNYFARSVGHWLSRVLLQRKGQPTVEFFDERPCVGADYSFRGQMAQCLSQLSIDTSYLLRSPFYYCVLVIGVLLISSNHSRVVGGLGLAQYPVTSLLLDFFTYGLSPYLLALLIYFSGELIHRDREQRSHEIVSASPYANWIMPISKILALWITVALILLVCMMSSIVLQALSGYTRFELGLYLQGVYLYNGASLFLTCVLAVFVQSLSANKWLGMMLTVGILAFVSAMPLLGLENLLYRVMAVPAATHSDMNGFAPFQQKAFSLIAYWGVFCILLVLICTLCFPRGFYLTIRQGLDDARARLTPPLLRCGLVTMLAFIGIGSWIYYNTHILNEYQTSLSSAQRDANYERLYGQYANRPTPDYQDIDLEVDLFPQERRAEASAETVMINSTEEIIHEFAFSIDPQIEVIALQVENGEVSIEDREQGFYLIELNSPLPPEKSINVSWSVRWSAQGFSNGDLKAEVVENGSFLETEYFSFLPGYIKSRELSNSSQRQKFGLHASNERLPELGDPEFINIIEAGISARSHMHITLSTSVDQIAVAPGVLLREWQENDRRFFEYQLERPIYPAVPLISGRYQVVRDSWSVPTSNAAWNDTVLEHKEGALNEVDLEIYFDAKHSFNIDIMLDTTKQALDYYTQEFGPYPSANFRILEIPRFRRNGAQAFPGAVAYSESAGFVSDMSRMGNIDFVTLHELAHQWWGGRAYGAYMQGREVLNETLAQYSAMMMYKQLENPDLLRLQLSNQLNGYLAGRSEETQAEMPLMFTEDQGYVSYNKGALVMYALQELIGSDKVHQGLRNYLHRFDFQPSPFPTSRDLVDELRAVAGEDYQEFITDQFEKIMFYEVQIDSVSSMEVENGYSVTIEYNAHQFEADGLGNEQEVAMNTWFDVVVFPQSELEEYALNPLYQQKHRLQNGSHSLSVLVERAPGSAGIDPFHLMIDRTPENNILDVSTSD